MKRLQDLKLEGKRVLMRVGFDLPLTGTGIADDSRIKAGLESVIHVLKHGGSMTLMTHMGRPQDLISKGEDEIQVRKRLSTLVIVPKLVDLLQMHGMDITADDIFHCDDYYDGHYTRGGIPPHKIILLENLRFSEGETSDDAGERKSFAEKLAVFGDFFVNNDFGIPNKKHASVFEIAGLLPCAAGHLLIREVEVLSSLLRKPERPFIAILGGAKVEQKVKVIENLQADPIIIVGAMKYAFDKAKGRPVGNSLCLGVDTAEKLLDGPKKDNIIIADQDIVARKFEGKIDYDSIRTVDGMDSLAEDEAGLDIGPRVLDMIEKRLRFARTVFWNGNAGLSEDKHFQSTFKLVELLAGCDAKVIVGGGDSTTAIKQAGFCEKDFFHVSTGGGASLALLSGKKLPALEALGY